MQVKIYIKRAIMVLLLCFACAQASAPTVTGGWQGVGMTPDFSSATTSWFGVAAISSTAAIYVGYDSSGKAALGSLSDGVFSDINPSSVTYPDAMRAVDFAQGTSSGFGMTHPSGMAVVVGDNGAVYRLDRTYSGGIVGGAYGWSLTNVSTPTPKGSNWTDNFIYGVDMVAADTQNIWFCGQYGFVGLNTTKAQDDDTGSTDDWGKVTVNASTTWYGVHAFSASSALIVGTGGAVDYLYNATLNSSGLNVSQTSFSKGSQDLYTIDFCDDNHGVIAGAGGVIYVTDTGGTSSGAWTEIPSLNSTAVTTNTIYAARRVTTDIIYVAGFQSYTGAATQINDLAMFYVGVYDSATATWNWSVPTNNSGNQGYVRAMDMVDETVGYAGTASSVSSNYSYIYEGTAVRDYYTTGNVSLNIQENGDDAVLDWTYSSNWDATYSYLVLRRAESVGELGNATADISTYSGTDSTVTYTDTNAMTAGKTYFYQLEIENQDATVLASSNVAYIETYSSAALTYNGDPAVTGLSNYNLISVPYSNSYADSEALFSALNDGDLDSGPVDSIIRWNYETQQADSTFHIAGSYYHYAGGSASGPFVLNSGEALIVSLRSNPTGGLNLVGYYDPSFQFNFTYNGALSGHIASVSLPNNVTYTNAQDLLNSLNNGDPANNIVDQVLWLQSSGSPDFYFYLSGSTYGNNFPIVAGQGYLINVKANITAWSPSLRD